MKQFKSSQPLLDRFFSHERYDDPESLRQARLLGTLLRVLLTLSVLIYLLMFTSASAAAIFAIATSMLLINLGSLFLLQRGQLRAAQVLLVIGILAVFSVAALFGGGVLNTPYPALVVVVLIAGLQLGNLAGLVAATVVTIIGAGLVVAELNGFLPAALLEPSPARFWLAMTLVFFACAGLIALVTDSLKQVAAEAQMHASAQAEGMVELQEIRASLEEQVVERTRELERRTRHLQAILEVTQSTASLLDSDQVVKSAVELIKEQFQLYYVGMFLVDLSGEWAVLKAGTGEAGQVMLSRGHRIRVGSGMIGWSIANAQPRVAAEAGQDMVRLLTPELPETRSEAAIPLRSRGRVIGALSVQSELKNAFGELEIASYQALGDQVAIALDNARLYSESRKSLEEARRAYGEVSRHSWQEFLHSMDRLDMTYRYGINESTPVDSGEGQPPVLSLTTNAPYLQARQDALESCRPVQISDEKNATLFLPIPVREVQIGVICFTKDVPAGPTYRTNPAHMAEQPLWSPDEVELLQSIVEQMGVALDSARLYQDTQRLAYRELVTGEVTARIRQTLDIQTVLRTAVEEIQRTLGVPEVVISLTPTEEESAGAEAVEV